MATDARGHTVPASTDHPSRADLLNLALSIRDAIPVANVTARAALIVTLSGLGITASTSNPIMVFRADAGDGLELEVTTDGSTWRTIGANMGTPVVTFTSANASSVASGVIVVPSTAFPAVSHATRVFVQVTGQAGFNAAAVDVAVSIGGSYAVTQGAVQVVPAPAAKYVSVSQSGYMDIPAGSASGAINIASSSSAGGCYYRLSVVFTRVNI